MAHIHADKRKLLARISRIKGQIASLESAVRSDLECYQVLQTIASCRGALSGLMDLVIEGHVRFHVIDPKRKPSRSQIEAAEQLLAVIKSYSR